MFKRILWGLFWILLILEYVNAQTLDPFSIEYEVLQNRVLVHINFEVELVEETEINYLIESDAERISVIVNGIEFNDHVIRNKNIIMGLDKGRSSVEIVYTTSFPLERADNYVFVTEVRQIYDLQNVSIQVNLPKGTELERPVEDGSVFPSPDNLETDGISISIIWKKDFLDKGDSFPMFIVYKEEKNYLIFGILIGSIVMAIAGLIIRKKFFKRTQIQIIKTAKQKPDLYLKDEEKQIIEVLRTKGGECEQGTLRVITDLSKATLSRRLLELEERNILKRVKKGKKNTVILKESL